MAIPHSINNPIFVFHLDVALLSLFALYVSLTLPRDVVRVFPPCELGNGLFLRSGTGPQTTSYHQSGTHGRSGSTRTRPTRWTSKSTNQTGRTLGDLPEGGGTDEWAKRSKAQRRAILIPPPRHGHGTRG